MNAQRLPNDKKIPVITSQGFYDQKARQARSDHLAELVAALGRSISVVLLASTNRFEAHLK